MVVGLDLDEDWRLSWGLERVGSREGVGGGVGGEESDLRRHRVEHSGVVRVGGDGTL